VGVDRIKRPDFLGALGCRSLSLLSKFQSLNLSYTPTSCHQIDAGAVIVGIICAIQVGGKFHISRKHTTAKEMRQANGGKFQ
jgi:hypothetical protein